MSNQKFIFNVVTKDTLIKMLPFATNSEGCVSLKFLQVVLSENKYNDLKKWLVGQTAGEAGPYAWDVKAWANGSAVTD